MNLLTKDKVSERGDLNARDWKKIARDTAIFFAAPSLMYLGQIQGTLSANGSLILSDLSPSLMTIGAVQGWAIGIAINFFLKLNDGSK